MRAEFHDAARACGAALERRLERVADALDDENAFESMRGAVSALALFASEERIPPERFLIAFKTIIQQLATVEQRSVVERTEIQRRLVEIAIEAYYSARESPSGPSDV